MARAAYIIIARRQHRQAMKCRIEIAASPPASRRQESGSRQSSICFCQREAEEITFIVAAGGTERVVAKRATGGIDERNMRKSRN